MEYRRDIRLASLLGLSCAGIALQPAVAQTMPAAPSAQQQSGPITLPLPSNGDVPSGDATAPVTQSTELPRPPLPQVDPVTGRPILVGQQQQRQSTDFIDQQTAVRLQQTQDAQPAAVPAYIALPTIVPDPFTLPSARVLDRALAARELPGNTVLQLRRPEFDPPGVRLGGILAHPYVSVSADGDSNIYAENDPRADAFATGTVGINAISDWGRHQVTLNGFVQRRQYAQYSSENGTSYQLAGTGRYDVSSHSSITASAITQQVIVPRNAVEDVISQAFPIQFQQTGGKLSGAIDYGSVEIGATAGVSRTHYDDNETADGLPLNESYRTHDSVTGQVTVGYDLPDQRSIYGELDLDHRRFAEAGIKSDSNVYSALAGVRGGITRLIRGHLAIGYLRIDFVSPEVRDIGSPTVDADLDWLVTRRTTISLRANRELQTVSQGNSHGALVTNLSLTAYREALRNLVLSASVQQAWSNYVSSSERAELTSLALGAEWLFDRHWRVEPQFAISRRTTQFFGLDAEPFDVTGGIGLTYRF